MINTNQIKSSKKIKFIIILRIIIRNFYIIAVPTPINIKKKPNLKSLMNASVIVGKILIKAIVVYESNVYPGLSEEFCIPILQKNSKIENQ